MLRGLVTIGICAGLASVASAAPGTVTITAEDTGSGLDADTCRVNAELLHHALAARLVDASTAHIDASVAGLTFETLDDYVAVTAHIRIAISDDHGTLLSVISSGARAEMPTSRYRASRLASLRKEALTGAVDGVAHKVAVLLPHTSHLVPWFLATKLAVWFGWVHDAATPRLAARSLLAGPVQAKLRACVSRLSS